MGKGVWTGLCLAFLCISLAFGQEDRKRTQYEGVSFRLSSFWTEEGKKEGEWVVYPAKTENAYLQLAYNSLSTLSGMDFEAFLGKDLDRVIDLKEGDVLYGSFSGKLFRCSYTQGKERGHCELFAAPGRQGLYFFRLLTRTGASRDCISRYYEVLSTLDEVPPSPTPTQKVLAQEELVVEKKVQVNKEESKKEKENEEDEGEDEENVILIAPTEKPGREVLLIARRQATPSPTPYVSPTPKPDRSAAYPTLTYEEVGENLSAFQDKKIQISGQVIKAEKGLLGLYSTLQIEDTEGGLWFVTYTYTQGEIPLEEGEDCVVLGTLSGSEKTLRREGKIEHLYKINAVDLRRQKAEKKKKEEEAEPSYNDILLDPDKYQGKTLTVSGTVEKKEKPLFSLTAEIQVLDKEGNLWNCMGKAEVEAGEEVRFRVTLKDVVPFVWEGEVRKVPVVLVEKVLPLEEEIEEEEAKTEEEEKEEKETAEESEKEEKKSAKKEKAKKKNSGDKEDSGEAKDKEKNKEKKDTEGLEVRALAVDELAIDDIKEENKASEENKATEGSEENKATEENKGNEGSEEKKEGTGSGDVSVSRNLDPQEIVEVVE